MAAPHDVIEVKDWSTPENQEFIKKFGYGAVDAGGDNLLTPDVPVEEVTDNGEDEKNFDPNLVIFPVEVFVRVRPMVGDELKENHPELEYKCTKTKPKPNNQQPEHITSSLHISMLDAKKKKKTRKFAGFEGILKPKDKNLEVFNKAVQDIIPKTTMEGKTMCVFAYGHTGSGKTHTMIGYGGEMGIYGLAAKQVCAELDKRNQANGNNGLFLEVRVIDIYQGKVQDLIGKYECTVREADGKFHVRGETLKDEEGRVKVRAVSGEHCRTPEEVVKAVEKGLGNRVVGSSSLHEQSSRSHAILEFEIVSQEVVEMRREIVELDADVVPWGKKRDDESIRIESSMIVYDEKTGKYGVNPDFVEPDRTYYNELDGKVKELEAKVREAEKKLEKMVQDGDGCLCGCVVFVDLAGNEYGADAGSGKDKQAAERNEINKSLLSLKECIRALHNFKGKKKHVPYRNSHLTKLLRKHLTGDGSTAIMIANVSSSGEHVKKTVNTLAYSELVAKA